MMQMHSSTSPVNSVVDHAEDHPTLPSATKTHWTNIEEDELVKFLMGYEHVMHGEQHDQEQCEEEVG